VPRRKRSCGWLRDSVFCTDYLVDYEETQVRSPQHDHPMTPWVEFRYQSQEFARIGACQCEGEPLMRVTPARV